MSEPIRVLAAGSLRHAMPEIAAAFERASGIAASLTFGPAGLAPGSQKAPFWR